MKKTTITFLMAGFLAITGLKAQTLQEGYNHLTADRFKSAIAVFEKLLAANPNNMEAVYWLGQTYFDMDDNAKARQLYQKALETNGSHPLILVGLGHADLLDNKKADAMQKFEAAITVSRGRKGDDPAVLTAIGRANVDAKFGDFNYAIEKLKIAAEKDPRNTETLLQLGNAYRKARPGEGGGPAFENYKKALQVNPNFAVASLRLAKIFQTQRNWDFFTQYLNDAIRQDPAFAPAYYELFYYYFFQKKDFTEAENQLKKYIANMDSDVQNEYLYAQLCWARGDFGCAITKAESVANAMGQRTKPKVYKLLADAYFSKGDYTNAKKYLDIYFTREKPEDFIAFDYKLKAEIMGKMGANCEDMFAVYMQGAQYDTVLNDKIDYMTIAADSFRSKGCKKQEADMRLAIFNLRPNSNPAALVNIGVAYSQAGELQKADSLFAVYSTAFPDSIYGHYWRGRVNFSLDTTMKVEPYATNMVKGYQKALEVAALDKARFKSLGVASAQVLAGYYNNIKADKATALEFTNKGLEFDSTNTTLKYIKSVLERPTKSTTPRGNTPPKSGNSKPAPSTKPKATAVKPAGKN